MMPQRLCFIVESGADVRLVEGLAERFELEVLARRIPGGVEISWPPSVNVAVTVGPASRLGFARMVFRELRKRRGRVDFVIVQGYGAAALAANVAGRLIGVPTFMLVCSPVEKYYLCRRAHAGEGRPFRRRELFALDVLARVNALAGQMLDEGRDLWLLHRSGGYREFLKDAARYGLGERVIATDAVHPHRGLADDYRASDLCVQASREEGLGFSPLEALACGVPVVAARVGGLRETIIDGETGWSYPVGDASALARCIEESLGDTEEAARRTANGRAMVCERYERRVVFEKLLEALGARVQVDGALPDDGQRVCAAD
ncbi:MAG: glycosyltransferase family 4 protein [Acidobacteria bacterium]|nr:glycosyltransferase family 4 protein [Acidobacteriota bacterium]